MANRTTRTAARTAQRGRRAGATRRPAAVSALQPKLDVNPSTDRFEAEADRVASHVMQGGSASSMPEVSALLGPAGGQRAAKEGKAETADKIEVKEKDATRAQKKSMPGKDEDRNSSGRAQRAATPGKKDEEKKAQRVAKPAKRDEEKKAQRAVKPGRKDEDRKAQKKSAAKDGNRDEEKPKATAQRDASGDGFTVPQGTEASISSMQRGAGAPLDHGTQAVMESRIGRDFSGVRVHDTPAAHQAADDLGARAFTVGQDVFFARGAYSPDQGAGKALIAHELTHTIQQGGGSARAKRVQRADTPKPGAGKGKSASPPGDTKKYEKSENEIIDTTAKKLTVPELKLPKIGGKWKGESISAVTTAERASTETSAITGVPPFVLHRPSDRTGDTQRKIWFDNAKTSFKPKLKPAIEKIAADSSVKRTKVTVGGQDDSTEIHYLRKKGGKATSAQDIMIGTADELAEHPNILIPTYNTQGAHRSGATGYEVDHVHELQLGGAHKWENLWLLHSKANGTSGAKIKAAVEAPIRAIAKAAKTAGFWVPERGGSEPSLATFKKEWSITFMQFAEDPLGLSGAKMEFFKKEDIRDGEQLKGLTVMTDAEKIATGLGPVKEGVQPTEFSIFPYPTGGTRFSVKKKGEEWKLHNRKPENFLGGFTSFAITYDFTKGAGAQLGMIEGTPKPRQSGLVLPKAELPLLNDARLGYSVYIDSAALKAFPRSSTFIGLSPLGFDYFGIGEDGLFRGQGRITASAYLFKGVEVPFELHGDQVTISFPLPTDKLVLGPVSVDQASLQLGLDSKGIVLGGSADISVNQLGTGRLEATVSKDGPRVAGEFNFDLDFLDDPTAKFLYDMGKDELSLSLDAGVKAGKIPGIASGKVTAKFSKESVDVTGTLTPSGFLGSATVTVGYTKETGLTIEAKEVPLPLDKVPAIKDAKVSVGVNRNPEGVWLVYGAGSAQFALPAVTGGMTVAVKADVITFSGEGKVAKGPATGALGFTATNQQVDESGQPVEGPALDYFRTWGKGSVTVSFGKILTGTSGIELTEQGEIIVRGEIGLPPNFEVFPVKKYEKQLLHVEPPEFPIWGVSVAGIGIGIFAFVDAKLSFDAFVGPGQLKETKLTATYNFVKPEEAVVDGNAIFDVPAGAGFTLDAGGGLRARLATAQVSGRVGLDARLGIEANAGAGVKVHWTPAEGLSLAAKAYAKASPKFEIGANASVTASVDLWLAEPSYTWGPWRKQLGSFGPNMSVGVEFPVSWSEKNGLDLSLDNIKVTKPDIDAGKIMKDTFLALV